MYVTIYLDLIMLLCFMFNGAILLLVSYLVKQRPSLIRIFSGTFLATLFVPIVIYFPNLFLNTILGKIIYSIAIIIVSFQVTSIGFIVKSLLTFYLVSFIGGGAIISLHYIIEHSPPSAYKGLLVYVENIYHNEVSLVLILLGFPLTLIITKIWSDKLVLQQFTHEQKYRITLHYNNCALSTLAFLDSGNHLVDPISNRAVIIADALFLKGFFEVKEWLQIEQTIQNNRPELIPHHLAHSFSVIPFKTVADSHFLYAIKPDKLIIEGNKERIVTSKLLVGIQLSSLTNDGQYHCLLHPQIVALQATEKVS